MTDLIQLRNKVRILRETADQLEAEQRHYDWDSPDACVIGNLAHTLYGSPAKVACRSYSWTVDAYCQDTGYAISPVIRDLFAIGFDTSEIQFLEFDLPYSIYKANTSDLGFWERLEIAEKLIQTAPSGYQNRLNAIARLRQLADEIDRQILQQQCQQATPAAIPVTVSVSE